jgi:hypothetical protein
MSFNFHDQGFIPCDSYSRQLDRRVAMDEYPYGYEAGEPPAGHHNTQMVHKYKNEKEMRQKEL